MEKLISHIKSLIKSGWSQHEIAAAVETSQPTIHRILNGIKCSYDVGKNIECLRPKKKAA